ncbi:MAG: hypothetical protein RIC55_09860 [Pirellulaceae bacterium]
MSKEWKTYEDVATYLLDRFAAEFGLDRVEGKQRLPGGSTTWEIDAKGVYAGDEAFVLVECRRHTTARLDQESLAAFAYRVSKTGATGGIVVSPLGLQAGAQRIADAENVVSVKLTPTSTPKQFAIEFFGQLRHGGYGNGRTAAATCSGRGGVRPRTHTSRV